MNFLTTTDFNHTCLLALNVEQAIEHGGTLKNDISEKQRFSLGQVVITKTLDLELGLVGYLGLYEILEMYKQEQWGAIDDPEYIEQNSQAVIDKEDIMGIYFLNGIEIWISTIKGHKKTIVCLHEECG